MLRYIKMVADKVKRVLRRCIELGYWYYAIIKNKKKEQKSECVYERVYVCHTYYHFLVSTICQLKNNKKTAILLSKTIPTAEELCHGITELGIFAFSQVIDEDSDYSFVLKMAGNRVRPFSAEEIEEVFHFRSCKEVIIFNDWTPVGLFLQSCWIKYNLYEDGKDCYSIEPHRYMDVFFRGFTHRNFMLRRFFGRGYCPYGTSPCAKKVFVNNPEIVRRLPMKMMTKMDKEELFGNLDAYQKERLNLICTYLFKVPEINQDSTLILFTMFDEVCGRIVTRQEIEGLLSEIKKNICKKKSNIYLKPHPRDKNEYYKQLLDEKNIYLLDRHLPSEVVQITGMHFATVISIGSTAATNGADEIISITNVKDFLDGKDNSLHEIKQYGDAKC